MEPNYKEALRIVAQALAWHCFGECRSFGEDVPLLTAAEANIYAKFVLDMGGSDTTNERKYSGDFEITAKGIQWLAQVDSKLSTHPTQNRGTGVPADQKKEEV